MAFRTLTILLFVVVSSIQAATKHGLSERYFWNADVVIKTLQYLARRNQDLSPGHLNRQKTQCFRALAKKATGHEFNGSQLYSAAGKYYGSYSAALEASGLGANRIRRNTIFNRDTIGKALRSLDAAGISIMPRAMLMNRSIESKLVIFGASGLKASAKLLYMKARKISNNNYRQLLLDSGLDPTNIVTKYARSTNLELFSLDWIDDARKRPTPPAQSVYAQLKESEIFDAIDSCIKGFPEVTRDFAYEQIESVMSGEDIDEEFADILANCLRGQHFEYVIMPWENYNGR